MSDRRNFLFGAGAAFLAALPDPAAAGPAEQAYIYAEGVVWNPTLSGLLGQLRLNVYLAVKPDGTGTGTVNDPVHTQVNSHVRVLRTSVWKLVRVRRTYRKVQRPGVDWTAIRRSSPYAR